MSEKTIDETLEKWQGKVKEELNLPDAVSVILDQTIGMISAGDEVAGKFQEQVEALIPSLPDEDRKRISRFLLDFNYIQGICRLKDPEDCKQGTQILAERVREFKGEVEKSPNLMTILNRKVETPS